MQLLVSCKGSTVVSVMPNKSQETWPTWHLSAGLLMKSSERPKLYMFMLIKLIKPHHRVWQLNTPETLHRTNTGRTNVPDSMSTRSSETSGSPGVREWPTSTNETWKPRPPPRARGPRVITVRGVLVPLGRPGPMSGSALQLASPSCVRKVELFEALQNAMTSPGSKRSRNHSLHLFG